MNGRHGRKKPPCFRDGEQCPKRHMTCHVHCEEYKEYEEDRRLFREFKMERCRQLDDLKVTRAKVAALNEKHERDRRR